MICEVVVMVGGSGDTCMRDVKHREFDISNEDLFPLRCG